MRGASLQSLGIVYATGEAASVEKAAEQYAVPRALQNRIVVRPWLE